MNCPICGHKLSNNKAKCVRCGYIEKGVSVFKGDPDFDNEKDKNGGEKTEKREVNPKDVHMGRAQKVRVGGFFDSIFSGGSLFDSILGSLFGGFGVEDESDYYDPEDELAPDEKGYILDDFGNPIPVDVFENEFVEIDEDDIDEIPNK